jgi:hypothetical protein
MNKCYYTKYLKYKTKYLNLKGGFNKDNKILLDIINNYKKNDRKINKSGEADIKIYNKENKSIVIRTEKDRNQNRYNWLVSSQKEIAPKIYFYGYDNDHKLVIISDAYKTNLEEFYKKESHLLNDKINKVISTQIIKLIEDTINEMNIYCIDIKPSNCVINYEVDDKKIDSKKIDSKKIDIKLIDWSDKFCTDIPENMYYEKEIIQLCIMLMANHFYYTLNNNIFIEHFEDTKSNFDKENLKKIANKLKTNNSTFKDIVTHYFFKSDKKQQDNFFEIMYDNCFKKSPEEEPSQQVSFKKSPEEESTQKPSLYK